MGLKEPLFEVERQLWNADEELYREKLSEGAVMVFPEPTGIRDRTEIIGSLGGSERWSSIEFSNERLIEINDEVVQLVYQAVAKRSEDDSEYGALITGTYVQKNASWSLISHQQTPTTQ